MSRCQWFEVDHDGLAEIAKRRGMAFIITEPIQNAWDEDTTVVEVELTAVPGAPKVDLLVRDDSPNGFRDLADSYKMFRASYKLANPEQRGRFNIGEKLLLAIADEARVMSTTGSVIFGPKGRTTGRKRTEVGSVLTARLRMTRAELNEALEITASLIAPAGITTIINGEVLPEREPIAEGEYRLSTEIRGEEGGFKYVTRKTMIRIYATLPGETAHLYEMGIPIDEIECPWHIDVAQKVPLSIDRGSVRYGYLGDVQRFAGELMATRLTEEESTAGWVSLALESMEDDDAVKAIVYSRFGKDAVIYDPSAPESNKLAIDDGVRIIHGRELSKMAWQSVRRVEAFKSAGQVYSDGKVEMGPNGIPPVPRDKWTDFMKRLADYTGDFAMHVLDHHMSVSFYDDSRLEFAALCGCGGIAINVGSNMMKAAIEEWDRNAIHALLIHECAHDAVSDHLTHAYHRECCRIGALAMDFTGYLAFG